MQVPAIIFTSSQENQLLTMGFAISSLHQWFICIHLSYSYLTTSRSFFLFPFNTNSLLNQHREAVYSPRLHSDCGRPTTIFRTTFTYLYSRFAIHGTTCGSGAYSRQFHQTFLTERVCFGLVFLPTRRPDGT